MFENTLFSLLLTTELQRVIDLNDLKDHFMAENTLPATWMCLQ